MSRAQPSMLVRMVGTPRERARTAIAAGLWAFAVSTAGCGSSLRAPGIDGATTSAADVAPLGDGGAGGQASGGSGGAISPSDGPDGSPQPPADAGTSCATIAAAIASQTSTSGSCTAVVRVDYASLAILSHAFVCGRYNETDEAAARATANTITLPSSTGAGAGTLVSGSDPPDEWVFVTPPSDVGGAAAVSVRSGLLVFAGTTIYMGTGEILFPLAWDDSDLGSGCASLSSPRIRTLSLAATGSIPRMMEAANAVLATALPAGLWQWGYVFDVMVLLYPRTTDPTDPKTTDLIVLVNAGWLE